MYFPPLLVLFLTILSTIFAASVRIVSENLSASKLAKHLSAWTFGGTA